MSKEKKSASAAAPAGSFVAAAELAGQLMAHAVWCVSEGEALVPMLGHEGKGGRGMQRFVSEDHHKGVESGLQLLEHNLNGALRAVLIYDSIVTVQEHRTDAVTCHIVEYGPPRQSLEMVLPYRPAKDGEPFVVYKPKFTALAGVTDSVAAIGEAFFRGVDSHEQGAQVWNDHLDQSR
jgi:hypothetical protein